MQDQIVLGDNLDVLPRFADATFQLAYLDPPFNTGRPQTRRTLSVVRDERGDRTGFGGRRYRSELLETSSYRDSFDDYLAFLEPRLRETRRVLRDDGTLYFHIDYREAHYCKLLLDELFGRECFLNELVWAYDYGARAKRRWPAKHDTILVYVKDPAGYYFDSEAVDREPYMAPGLVGAEKAARGKLADRRVVAHDRLADRQGEDGLPDAEAARRAPAHRAGLVAAGRLVPRSSPAAAPSARHARELGRGYVLIDSNPDAVRVMQRRLPSDRLAAGCRTTPTS